MKEIGIVIPTILGRPGYLPMAASSIEAQGAFLLISCPKEAKQELVSLGVTYDQLVQDQPKLKLAQKINAAINSFPNEIKYVGWLGDDDLLLSGSIAAASNYLDEHPECVMVYGGCDYIDQNGKILFTNKSSQFATSLLSFGPQLIPQPGALWRRSAFEAVGGLSGEFNLAFDFDLFLKLKTQGQLKHLPMTLAQFRWHSDSLSVKKRWTSVTEASRVRRKHYRGAMMLLWPLWEPFVILATWLAGKLVSFRFDRY